MHGVLRKFGISFFAMHYGFAARKKPLGGIKPQITKQRHEASPSKANMFGIPLKSKPVCVMGRRVELSTITGCFVGAQG
jgi:hypothetical protein